KSRKVQTVIRELEQQTGRVPTLYEVADALGISPAEYEQLLDEIRPATFVCLDSAGNEDDGCEERHESIPDGSQPDPSQVAAQKDLSALIRQRIGKLPAIQKKVLALYYFEDLRLREIAQVFGVTESRICQIHAQALLTIKASLRRRAECEN